MLSKVLPWDDSASIYYKTMSADHGAPGIDAKIIIGVLIIKHLMKPNDRRIIETIQENPYIQYLLGLSAFIAKPVFNRSLFMKIRKRIGVDAFDQMITAIIRITRQNNRKPASAKLILKKYHYFNPFLITKLYLCKLI